MCALQGTVHAGLEAASERLLAASRAEAEQEVHAQHTFERIDARGALAARRHLPSRRAPRTQARTPARPPLLPPCAVGEARPRARGERAPARGVTRRHRGGAACGARRGAWRRIRGARGLSACPTRESRTESHSTPLDACGRDCRSRRASNKRVGHQRGHLLWPYLLVPLARPDEPTLTVSSRVTCEGAELEQTTVYIYSIRADPPHIYMTTVYDCRSCAVLCMTVPVVPRVISSSKRNLVAVVLSESSFFALDWRHSLSLG